MVVMEAAVLDDVPAAFEFHAVISRMHDFEALEVPATFVCLEQKGAIGVVVGLGRKVQDGVFVGERPNFDRRGRRAGVGYGDGVAVSKRAAAYPNRVTR